MKIIIDAFGSDYPKEVVKGAIDSINLFDNLTVVLAGDEKAIIDIIEELKNAENFVHYDVNRLEILNASEVISCDEQPTLAIRTKTDSSLVKSFDMLKKDDEVLGMISAGSTGAVLTGAFMKIGRMKGLSRPALCPALPTAKGTPVVLIDCGANMDCKPINLAHFALLGSKYYESMYGKTNPRVAILNVGVEDEKGNELVKGAMPLLKQLPINFAGSMEAREFLSGDYDVVVCDGFAGNTLLKGCEGAIITVMGLIKDGLKNGDLITKLGAVMVKKTLKATVDTFDYSNYGGSPFLGIKKIVIKSHGNSKAKNIVECVKQVIHLSNSNCYDKIQASLENLDLEKPENE